MKVSIIKPTGSQAWLDEMSQAHPNAVKSFQTLMHVNGFNTIGHVFAQINKSFSMIESFYVFTNTIFPITHTRIVESLQNYLELGFENFEEMYAMDNSIASHEIFQKKMDTREIVGSVVVESEKVSIEAPENEWLADVEKKFPISLKNFLGMLAKNGYPSLDAACADIEASFPLIERYLSNNGVQAPQRLKEDTLELQRKLSIAYRNSEEACWELAM